MAEAAATILIVREPGEFRYALLAGETVVDIALVRDGDAQPGARHVGRVIRRADDGRTCWVDLGGGEPGYLQSRHALPPEGQHLEVEVTASARPGKGPSLKRLAGASDAAGPPRLIAPGPSPAREWLSQGPATVIAANIETARRLDLGSIAAVTVDKTGGDLFERHGVDAAIDDARARSVPLTNGGSLTFEQTEAAWVIDVNAGAGAIDAANRAAMIAIARHLRLRNVSGHILIDAIPSRRRSDVRTVLERHCAGDPMAPRVAGFTPLGMLELTRRRTRRALAEVLGSEDRPLPKAIALRALRQAVRETAARRATALVVTLHAAPHAVLSQELGAAVAEAERMARASLTLRTRTEGPLDRIDIVEP